MSVALKEALDAYTAARAALRTVMLHDYPVTATVYWRDGQHLRRGTVVFHDPFDAELVARDDTSGLELWIEAKEIVPKEGMP